MPDNKNIQLKRHADGMASVLRKKTVYTELHFYRKSDVLVQLTKVFCERFLPKYGDRTVDQMIQAARSIKQNIAEGLTDGQTSFETELKLLGIAKGSNQELLEDYQDYLKHHALPEWALAGEASGKAGTSGISGNSGTTGLSGKTGASGQPGTAAYYAQRFDRLREFAKSHSDYDAYAPFFYKWTDEEMCNTAICLCHMVDKAMTSFIEKRDREFVEEGGIRERMTTARLDQRGTQKQIIAQLEAENATLKAQVASLQRELEMIKAGNPGTTGTPGNVG